MNITRILLIFVLCTFALRMQLKINEKVNLVPSIKVSVSFFIFHFSFSECKKFAYKFPQVRASLNDER